MTQRLKLCDKCGVFLCFVHRAGAELDDLCFPCYKMMLGKYGQALKWLNFREISGEETKVAEWKKYAANRQDNSVQEQVG